MSYSTVPLSGLINPAISRSSVDLPQPDGPRIATTSPLTNLIATSSTAATLRSRSPAN
ncbi:MAG: hypothetical protein U0703_19300 [Anaerolineae bacterium]